VSVTTLVMQGVVKPDGTLEVTEKLKLPAGRVQITVQPLSEPTQSNRFWTMMEAIWSDLRTSGRTSRTREAIDREINALREEAEEEMQAVERLQKACWRAREQTQNKTEPDQ